MASSLLEDILDLTAKQKRGRETVKANDFNYDVLNGLESEGEVQGVESVGL